MKRYAIAAAALAAALLAGCAGTGAASPAVPSLGAHPGAAAGSGRTAALRAAAQCIREHGISSYQDPVLTPGGAVYSDMRSFQDASQSTVQAVRAACGTAMTQAGLQPESEPPAPAQLVEAGVLAAECMRAHGLTHMPDPTAQSPYVPGHGFQNSGNVMPPGGKGSPVYQRAAHACRSLLDAEIAASTMASLGNEG
jgi:hypothetical protein